MYSGRVLIAGATGFLGSRLAAELVARGYFVAGWHRSGSNLDRLQGLRSKIDLHEIESTNLARLFSESKFDAVVNCLGDYGRSGESTAAANLILPLELLEHAVSGDVPLFLNAGTSLPENVNNYALTKNLFSDQLQRIGNRLVVIDAQLEHFYGGGESPGRFISHVITELLKPAEKLKLTAGEQRRDILYIDDAVAALSLLIEQGIGWAPGCHVVPVGSGAACSIREIVERIRLLTANRTTQIRFGALPYRKHEVMFSRADLETLAALGWKPEFTLDQGLAHTVSYYREQLLERRAA